MDFNNLSSLVSKLNVTKNSSKGWSNCDYLDMNIRNNKCDYSQQENQRILLAEFRKVVQDILQPHHDDLFLWRWLKARDFDVIKAEKMIRESFKFRKKIGADSMQSSYKLPEVYHHQPVTTTLGFDYENSLVRFFTAGICDYKGYVNSLRTGDLVKLLVYFLESDLKAMQEKKKKIGKGDLKSTFILDFQEFSLKKFYDKAVINAGVQLITMYQDNYPETLKAAYLINVPSYFSWIFNIFKPFLNAVTLSKIKIYKTDEWQEELRKVMDPKLIPVFMGGELTDPDGNPKCLTLINWNPKIDPSYYMKQSKQCVGEDVSSMTSVLIQPRGILQVPAVVKTSGSVLKWIFGTKDYNIRFGLFLKKGEKSSRMEEILPVETVDCQVIPEENEFICEKAGTYVLYFDNSYSWMTAKNLYYNVEVDTTNVYESNNN